MLVLEHPDCIDCKESTLGICPKHPGTPPPPHWNWYCTRCGKCRDGWETTCSNCNNEETEI